MGSGGGPEGSTAESVEWKRGENNRAVEPQPKERERSPVAAREAGEADRIFGPISCDGRKQKRMIWLPARATGFRGRSRVWPGNLGQRTGAVTNWEWGERGMKNPRGARGFCRGCSTGRQGRKPSGARHSRRFNVRTSSRVRPCPHRSRSSGINAALRIPRGAREFCRVVVQTKTSRVVASRQSSISEPIPAGEFLVFSVFIAPR